MIPGNIDLTEKLDFRKTVKKEIPQLPALWDGKNKLNTFIVNNNTSLSIISSYTTTVTYNNETRYNVNLSDWYADSLSNDNDIDNYLITSYWNGTTSTTFSTVNSSNIIYEIGKNKYIKYTSRKHKKDIFGNYIDEYVEEIPKIPWDVPKIYSHKRIPWEEKNIRYRFPHDETYIPSIPWEDEYEWRDRPTRYDLSDKYNRARNLLSWLSDKTRSFIERYFVEDDEKDLSYLTNMSWIRVSDAIIE